MALAKKESTSVVSAELAAIGAQARRDAAARQRAPVSTARAISVSREAVSQQLAPADRQAYMRVQNALDETIASMVPGDSRADWAADEIVPQACNTMHRIQFARALGIADPDDGGVLTDWTDINESWRQSAMLQSLVPHEDRHSVEVNALTGSVHKAIAGPRTAVDVDIEGELAALEAVYGPLEALEARASDEHAEHRRAIADWAKQQVLKNSGALPPTKSHESAHRNAIMDVFSSTRDDESPPPIPVAPRVEIPEDMEHAADARRAALLAFADEPTDACELSELPEPTGSPPPPVPAAMRRVADDRRIALMGAFSGDESADAAGAKQPVDAEDTENTADIVDTVDTVDAVDAEVARLLAGASELSAKYAV